MPNHLQHESLTKRLWRWRRKHGILTEKKERHLSGQTIIQPNDIFALKISCTKKRNYTISVETNSIIELHIAVEFADYPIKQTSNSRSHRVRFFSEERKSVILKITNPSNQQVQIESISIKMGGGTGCNNSKLNIMFSEGCLYKTLSEYDQKSSKKTPPVITRTRGFIDLLENGIPTKSITPQGNPKDAPYLYLLYSALSFNISGYTTRAHNILKYLNANAHTRLGYPEIISRHVNNNKDLLSNVPPVVSVDGIDYHTHSQDTTAFHSLPIKEYINKNAETLYEVYKHSPPKGIIAASNYINGYIGYLASRKLNVPFAYEMRGLWHITGVAKNPKTLNSDMYQLAEQSEIDLAHKAEKVMVLSRAMKQWLTNKGVCTEKISITPNGFDQNSFYPGNKPDHLLEKYKLQNRHVFGFIGSLVEYEGVDLLIRAFLKLREQHDNISLIIVGDGLEKDTLLKLSNQNPNIHFVGRVPHNEVLQYYHLCDTMVYARTSSKVCQLVPPLKPVEAMASGKLVICSDVAPMLDYLDNGKNGISFKTDSLEGLISAMESALNATPEILEMPLNGAKFVSQYHQWHMIAKRLAFLDQ